MLLFCKVIRQLTGKHVSWSRIHWESNLQSKFPPTLIPRTTAVGRMERKGSQSWNGGEKLPPPPVPELQLLHRWPLPASSAPHVKALTVCLTHKVGLVATSLSHWALTVPWRKGTVKSGCGSCFVASLKVRMTHLLFYARDDKRYWMCWRWQINAELMALAEEVIGGLQNQSLKKKKSILAQKNIRFSIPPCFPFFFFPLYDSGQVSYFLKTDTGF